MNAIETTSKIFTWELKKGYVIISKRGVSWRVKVVAKPNADGTLPFFPSLDGMTYPSKKKAIVHIEDSLRSFLMN